MDTPPSQRINGNGKTSLTAATPIVLRLAQLVTLVVGIWVLATNFEGLRYELRQMRETTDRLTAIVEGRMSDDLRNVRDRVIALEQKK